MRSGDRIRVCAQLIDAGSDTHLWAQGYDIEMRDLLSLQIGCGSGNRATGRCATYAAGAAAHRHSTTRGSGRARRLSSWPLPLEQAHSGGHRQGDRAVRKCARHRSECGGSLRRARQCVCHPHRRRPCTWRDVGSEGDLPLPRGQSRWTMRSPSRTRRSVS